MNVLFATYPMAFHTPGGGEMQLLAYRRHLLARGVGVTLLDPWAPDFLAHDLVHFFSTVGGSSHLCAFVRNLGLPLVVSSSLWVTEATADRFPIDEIRHQLFLADLVITNSDTEGDTLARLLGLPREKFVNVPNAVEARFLVPASPAPFREHFGVTGDFVLNVANIEPRKNQLRLVEAMRALPGHRLLLAGHVRDAAYLGQLLDAGGERVSYLGAIDHQSELLVSAYAAASVFALPSLFETPGLAALEAAGQGVPLVLTREGAAPEYFGAAADYVDPLSVESISAALRSAALSPPARTRYTPLTWDEAAAVLERHYRELLARRATGAVAGGLAT